MMPQGARILEAHRQGRNLCLWALVSSEAPLVERTFYAFATGEELPEDLTGFDFINTVVFEDFVWHVFEKV